MARLPAGVEPTPHKDRLRKYREELVKIGGRRLNVEIRSDANEALEAVMARDVCSAKEAVERALIAYANDGRRRPRA